MGRIQILLTLVTSAVLSASNMKPQESELYKCRATSYVLTGRTATNTEVRTGVCATGREEWLNKTLLIYQRLENDSVGKLLYILHCEDSGCKENVIDIWADGMDNAQAVMDKVYEDGCGGKIYVKVLDDCSLNMEE